jgi:hypothetical protein
VPDIVIQPPASLQLSLAVGQGPAGPPGQPGPGGGSDAHYVHNQPIPSDTWTIVHGLGKRPAVSIVDSAGDEVEGTVRHDSSTQLTIFFSAGFAGQAFLN